MTYQVTFTETTNPAKPPITISDGALNNQTSVTFVGQGYTGFAPVIANNLLHLLENFASPFTNPPSNPVEGQMWYDTTNKEIKVFDGTTWSPAGSLKKASSAPEVANSTAGDLWVDTNNAQLYLFSGSTWLLIGPQFSSGTLTGPNVETIIDTANIEHNVIVMYANNARISIISKEAFTPKATIVGFSTINQGITLSTVDATSTTTPTKFWGTATAADALMVSNRAVSASNFLRADSASVTNYPLSVRADGGISIGSDSSFSVSIAGNSTVLYSSGNGNSIDMALNNGGVQTTVVHVTADAKVGIGPNAATRSPASTLDVDGVITTSGGLNVTNVANSTSVTSGSIKTAGGLGVALDSTFGGTITARNQILVNSLDSSNNPVAAAVLLPGTASADATYDIGTSSRRFRNVYATNFLGNFNGLFTGTLDGSITGKASGLVSSTTFKIEGDISAGDGFSFNGQTTTGQVVFQTTTTPSIITARQLATDSQSTDEILVHRTGTGLMRMPKDTLLKHVPVMPVGVFMPFAGTVVPPGYLLCDGSEVKVSEYSALFTVIGYTYKAVTDLIGLNTFALPDMRGRFPLGRDNMDNGMTVLSKNGSGTVLDAGGGSANRVTDVTADIVGAGSGSQAVTLGINNLPEHKHNLNSGNAQYYAGGIPGAGSDINAIPGVGIAPATNASGLPNSGGVISPVTGAPFNTLNPYATINYIIYTGNL
jgi:microcystin-dependent protein